LLKNSTRCQHNNPKELPNLPLLFLPPNTNKTTQITSKIAINTYSTEKYINSILKKTDAE
jgi:hypothetical protein